MKTNEPIDDGGPAFPNSKDLGMDLRDYFAAKAMAALIALPTTGDDSIPDEAWIARHSFRYADAMMEARK